MGLAFLITTEHLQLLSERKVLKEAEYAALLDAQAVVDTARREAQRIVREANSQAAEMRRRGHQEGLEEAKGVYADRLMEVAMGSRQQLQALRDSMVGLVTKAIQQFVLETDASELFEAALVRVDALIRHEPYISVHVAPEQEAAFRQALGRLKDEAGWIANVSVQADPALAEGSCVMHTASGTLEIGVDAQLQAFQRAIERSAPQLVGH